MRSALPVLLALGMTANAIAASSIDVTVTPTELTVGDRMEMIVTVRLDAGGGSSPDVRMQPWGETFGPAEILDIGPVETIDGADGSRLFRQRLVLALFQVGELTLPPVDAVLLTSEEEVPLTSVTTPVVVRSVLPAGDAEPEPKPPAPPQRVTIGRRFWWTAAALAATCLVALAAIWQKAGGIATADGLVGRPRLAPMEELRRALAALRDESEVVPLHAGVSLAVRRFLGRTLEFPAPESTTTEVKRTMRQLDLPLGLTRRTGELLSQCDMVKFARRNIELHEARSRLAEAQGIADRLVEALSGPSEQESEITG